MLDWCIKSHIEHISFIKCANTDLMQKFANIVCFILTCKAEIKVANVVHQMKQKTPRHIISESVNQEGYTNQLNNFKS